MGIVAKKFIISVLTVISILTCAVAGIVYSGNWVSFATMFNTALAVDVEATQDDTESKPDDEKIINLPVDRPDSINAVWLIAGIDFQTENRNVETMRTEIDFICDNIADLGFNTVFVTVKDEASTEISDGIHKNFDVVDFCLEALNKRGLFSVLTINQYSEINENGLLKFYNNIPEFVEKHDAGAYLLPDHSEIFTLGIEGINDELFNIIQSLNVDVPSEKLIIKSSFDDNQADKNENHFTFINKLMSENLIGAVYVEPQISLEGKDSIYTKRLEKWNAMSLENDCCLILAQRGDLIGLLQDLNSAEELIYQLSVCKEMNINTCFKSYSVLKDDGISGHDILLDFIRGNSSVLYDLRKFSIDNHKSTEITTNESKIHFRGGGSPNYPVTCNGKTLKTTSAGDFSAEYKLNLGNNKFVFEHRGETYIYNVKYKIQLIKEISPQNKVNAPGGTVIDIHAVALKGSTVYAIVNGSRVSLKQGSVADISEDEDYTPDYGSDFVSYFGKYTMPASKTKDQNLGKITVYALYNSLSESKGGASFVVNAKPVVPTAPPTTQAPTTQPPSTTGESSTSDGSTEPSDSTNPPTTTAPESQKMFTPYSYAGVSGKSRMIEITKNYTETMLMNPFNNNSNPFSSPLLKGTFDYVVGESSYGSNSYYNLASGKRINVEDAKLINNGYNLPDNHILVMSSSTNKSTNVNLSLKWKVPFNVKFNGQSFGKYYNDRIFGIKSFTATSVDFVFYKTTGATGNVDVSGSNTISKAQWISDFSNQTTTLRLTLSKLGVFYGYNVSYNSDGTLNIKIRNKPSNSLSGHTIMLDPGHGGSDPGAICIDSSSNYKYESQIALSIAIKVKNTLEANGANVIMTRNTNKKVLLDERVAMIRNYEPDMFISLHCDSVDSSSPMGTSAFYYKANSYPLADSIHKRLVSLYKNDFYKDAPQSQLDKVDRYTKYYAYKVIRVEECPAVLIEYGFVSNMTECRVLQSPSSQTKFAEATVQGINDYINSN